MAGIATTAAHTTALRTIAWLAVSVRSRVIGMELLTRTMLAIMSTTHPVHPVQLTTTRQPTATLHHPRQRGHCRPLGRRPPERQPHLLLTILRASRTITYRPASMERPRAVEAATLCLVCSAAWAAEAP